jgi:hypothetical protein
VAELAVMVKPLFGEVERLGVSLLRGRLGWKYG